MSSKYEFIDGEKANYPIIKMCRWAQLSTSGFYEWRSRPASATAQRRRALSVEIRRIFDDSDETYGYRRVHEQLATSTSTLVLSWCARSCGLRVWWPVSPSRTR